MKTKSKGFTLIELLAVIVILAIIALIATPTILGVIEKARKESAESSALGYIDAVEKQIAINTLDSTKNPINDGAYSVNELSVLGVNVKGSKPSDNSVIKVSKNQVVDYSLEIGNYKVNPDNGIASADKNGQLRSKEDLGGSAPTKKGPTMVVAQATETHKGIVYLNPANLDEYCDAENSISTTETKTGCMKWYIYNDEGTNYKMILDHNTTARIKWNDSNSNVAYESSNLKAVVDDLKTTSGWVVEPDLITADEVNTITGKTGFDASSTISWYYLDTKTQTKADFTSSRSKYDWLYNNLNKCKTDSTDYGCTIEDGNTYSGYGTAGEGQIWGYWTKTTVGGAGSGSSVWRVARDGSLSSNYANYTNYGVRPVITISKSIVS